jgi:hypothetical protein
MRPIVLLLAACLCAILLYDRVASPFPTRLQKLQHCLAASQLLEIELAKYRSLREAQLNDMTRELKLAYQKSLDKDLQATWDRLLDEDAYKQWGSKQTLQKVVDKEIDDRLMLERHFKLFWEAIKDPRTEASKLWSKHVETLPSETEIRAQGELVIKFARERDAALAALN